MKRSPLLLAAIGALVVGTVPAMAAPPVINDVPPPFLMAIADEAHADHDKSLSGMWDKYDRKDKGERREKWQEERQKIEAMSEDEREAYLEEKAEKHRARMMERIENLPPEKQEEARAKLAEMEARKKEMREELMALPPEERKERMKEMREEYHAKRSEKMKEKFQNRWDNATDEDKAAFCAKTAEHCADKGEDERGHHLCARAESACTDIE